MAVAYTRHEVWTKLSKGRHVRKLFIYLAVLDICCYMSFSSCSELLQLATLQLWFWVSHYCRAQALERTSFSTCGAWALLLRGLRDLPESGIERLSPALAGEFFTTETPGKPRKSFINFLKRLDIIQRATPWSQVSVCARLLRSCPNHCDPLVCSLPGSSVHGDSPET